jgi:hypothetical protein
MGPSDRAKTAMDQESTAAQSQIDLAQTQKQREGESYSKFLQYLQPQIDKQLALAGGDRSAALAAALPVISQISKGYAGSKAAIMRMPAGTARDFALMQLENQSATGTGGAMADMVQQAPDALERIGSGFGNMSMQQSGAAYAGYQGGASAAAPIVQQENQRRASTLNFFSGLAGAAGGILSGGLLGGKSNTSGGGGSSWTPSGNSQTFSPAGATSWASPSGGYLPSSSGYLPTGGSTSWHP